MVRQRPKASDYFSGTDEVGIRETESSPTEKSDAIPVSNAEHIVTGPTSGSQPNHAQGPFRPETKAYAPSDLGHNEQPRPKDRQIAAQFLRGLVCLIKEIRDDGPTAVSTSPAPGPEATTRPASHHPAHVTSQGRTASTPIGPQTAQSTAGHDEQVHHLDAHEAARQARLALKDQFEDIAVPSSTPGHAPPTMTPVSHNKQPEEQGTIQTTTNLGLSLPPKPQLPVLTIPNLIETVKDGKITLHLDGMANGDIAGRLLYPTGGSEQVALGQIGDIHTVTQGKAGGADIVIERIPANYRALVAAYYHLRQRKADLVTAWKLQNPTRTHLISKLPYEMDDDDSGLPSRRKKSPAALEVRYYRRSLLELGYWGTSEDGAVARRVFFIRTKAVYSTEPETEYIHVNDQVHVKEIKKPTTAIVLAETEDVYRHLSWFVQNVKAQDWADQPHSNKRKRPTEDQQEGEQQEVKQEGQQESDQEEAGGPPCKKAKTTTTKQPANMGGPRDEERAEPRETLEEDVKQRIQETDENAQDRAVELTQTAVMVWLDGE
jgi:hypothetical protein